jgi:hypothetical protein
MQILRIWLLVTLLTVPILEAARLIDIYAADVHSVTHSELSTTRGCDGGVPKSAERRPKRAVRCREEKGAADLRHRVIRTRAEPEPR